MALTCQQSPAPHTSKKPKEPRDPSLPRSQPQHYESPPHHHHPIPPTPHNPTPWRVRAGGGRGWGANTFMVSTRAASPPPPCARVGCCPLSMLGGL